MYNCSDFLMGMWNCKSGCSRGSGKQSRMIIVHVSFLGICPQKSDWKNIGSKKKMVTDEWNVNEVQEIAYSDRASDLDHFERSLVHPRQNIERVMEDLN